MNLYTCAIDLKNDAKALVFAKALDDWMSHLRAIGAIESWRLMRRKLNLASGAHRDFLLEIEVKDMTQLDKAFRALGAHDDTVEGLYELIAVAETGLYRPFPDPERAERMALI